MFISPSIKYYGLKIGQEYRLLGEGRDYKNISVQGRPLYVPNYVFDGRFEEIEENEENYEG